MWGFIGVIVIICVIAAIIPEIQLKPTCTYFDCKGQSDDIIVFSEDFAYCSDCFCKSNEWDRMEAAGLWDYVKDYSSTSYDVSVLTEPDDLARELLEQAAFSEQGLIDFIEESTIVYTKYHDIYSGVASCGANWYEEADRAVKEYLEVIEGTVVVDAMTKERMIDQLEYIGFTYDEAVYGAEQNGF